MAVRILNNNWKNETNNKEELTTLLESYKGILNNTMIEYLNSLIELEFSVIRDYINTKERIALSELEVYKKIAIYNIYNRALKIFKQNEYKLSIKDEWNELKVSTELGSRYVQLFDFSYREGPMNFQTKVPLGYKTMKVGDISLFQSFESEELRQKELQIVMFKLKELYDAKCPYPSRPGIIGGPNVTWEFNRTKKIKEYEDLFKQLDSKKELTAEDKKEIELTKHFRDLLLEDYGLTDSSFKDESLSLPYSCLNPEHTTLQKTLVKRMPNINIKNNIKYI